MREGGREGCVADLGVIAFCPFEKSSIEA